jgi:hypothetical protein
MTRINVINTLFQFLVFVVIQLPLLYKLVFLDTAFGFFYIGFLLLLPYGLNPFLRLGLGFLIGILVDTFSNTPGVHAFACTLIMFVRDYWYLFVNGDPEDETELSVPKMGIIGTLSYLLPVIFIHLLLVFTIEHGKWLGYSRVFLQVIYSSVFTFVIIVVIAFLITPRSRRI